MNNDDLIYIGGTARRWRTLRNGHLKCEVVALVGDNILQPVNADGPEFVPSATLYSGLEGWPGKPVTFNHRQPTAA